MPSWPHHIPAGSFSSNKLHMAPQVDLLLLKLDQLHAQYVKLRDLRNHTGERPVGRVGFCGLCGPKVDLLDYYK